MATRKKSHDTTISPEAEGGLLGSLLLNGDLIPKLSDKIEPEDFAIPANRTTYAQLLNYQSSGKKFDLIAFTQFMADSGTLEEVGGASYLTDLYAFVPSPSNHLYYLEIVKDRRLLRDIVERAEKTVKYATTPGEFFSVAQILERAQVAFGEMKKFSLEPEKTLADWMDEKAERMQTGEPDDDIIFTRLSDLDRLSKLRRGDMPVIKAYQKVGKSTLALTILENIAIHDGKPALYFSLEDRTAKVMDRLLAGIARISVDRHHVRRLTPGEQTKAVKAMEKICASQLVVVDNIFALPAMIARAKKMKLDHPDLALVVVDYAQLINVEVKKSDTREREIAIISRSWRQFAMESGVPVLLLSQVNKEGATRESKALEQDCTACWEVQKEEGNEEERTIYIEFQRDGKSGVSFPLRFLGAIHRMENPVDDPSKPV
jgi:replicative DNA helicase